MRTVKVVESVDIQAPREEVFNVIANCDRRLQLSPLWGTSEIKGVSPEFPREGSSYRVKLTEGDDEYDTVVTEFAPCSKFAYRLDTRRQTNVTWILQDVTQGTRVIYTEEFLVDEAGDDDFVQSVRKIVQQWLTNIRRYNELREGRPELMLKWVLDRYVLRLRADQRRAIMMILALQAVSFLSFVAVALGWALISLVL